MAERSLVFIVPGEIASLTGGYGYARRIIDGLRSAGWTVDLVSLHEGFPHPDAAARDHAAAQIAAIADGRLVVADGLAFGAMPELVAPHRQRLRWVALVHHPLAQETGLGAADSAALFDSEQRALAMAPRVIVTGASTARALHDYGVDASRIHVVEPGVDRPTALPTTPSRPLGSGHGPTLLCVATLTPRKGHAVLIEALAGLQRRDWSLHCVGSLTRDEDTVRQLRALLDAHGMAERVHLHGEVDGARLAAHYERADLFVLPSFHEGYGMVLAEAMVHGLPIVSTTAGAVPDTVPADAGLLVPPGDVPALRAALALLLDAPERRAALAHAARAAAARLPTWPSVAARFAAALASDGAPQL